ncbi:LamG domain-containing protein [Planktothrix agardhii]|uniref:LamG domain-containing protein n=1 Tax=Planktothrix agardhii TaxID=1160 RepID=UPI00040EBA4B|nr:LamG domain-containing protein [Planktothrix agardhii]
MYLTQQNLQHINSITHEGKVLVFATDATGKISYTVKQDGFEDSYLNTPPDQRTGWESWKSLELPNETDDKSVIDQETAKLTHQKDTSNFILRSRYKTDNQTAVAPVQAISALGHIYIFRQSKSNTFLVDRFVLDGMTNKLNRKLEVRFKRSKQKHTPTKNMNKGSNGVLNNIDTLDFRDADGNFFYEPTTELCLVNNLHKGWFSVVLVPTIENDVHRWHIFAYNSQTQKVELTTIRTSEEGLFEVKDYTIFEEINETLVPRQIPGIIKRTLDISGTTITNGLTATQYDLQQEQQTQSGEMQLLKTATRLMLAIPTDKGTATLNFAIAGDGTLAEINKTAAKTILRSKTREILLPLNTLDEIKALADSTPPPQGMITGLAEGTDEDDAENLVKIATQGKASQLTNGDLVKITGTRDYQGLYQAKTVDENTFDINLGLTQGLGYWEKEEEEEGGLIFDGMITAYEKTADGKLRVTCPNHGLDNGDEVQIAGTENYNDSYPVKKLDDTHFVIERQWAIGSAINIKLVSRKRRGIVFDGTDHHVALPEMNHNYSQGITIEAWVWYESFKSTSRIIDFGNGENAENIVFANEGTTGNLIFQVYQGKTAQSIKAPGVLETGKWMHLAATIDESGRATLYKNGEVITTGSVHLPKTINRTKNYIARSNWSGDQYFQGKISDVRIWKTSRTAEDIKNSMYLQLTGKEVGLVGYWRLGAIGEGKVVDFSSNGQDGTVYGDAYVSAATLNRKLASGLGAVKYSNDDLFAVSERATYEESFEFKVVSSSAVNLAYLNNADSKNLGTKLFKLSYWGKASRSAEKKREIEQIKQNEFEDLGGGWYRVSGNVTIPDGISMLRCFEIANVQGNWQSLEIRKHRIRLMSESITEFKYSDSVSLTTLADNQKILASKLKELELKEQQEGVLLKEKRELEAKIAAYNAQSDTRDKVSRLTVDIQKLTSEEQALSTEYLNQKNSPFNYYCYIINLAYENYRLAPCGYSGGRYGMVLRPNGDEDYFHKWKFVSLGQNSYHIINLAYENYRLAPCGYSGGRYGMVLRPNGDEDYYHKWKYVSLGQDTYHIINLAYENYRLAPCGMSGSRYNMVLRPNGDEDYFHKWKVVSLGDQSNNNISLAYNAWQAKLQQLNQAKEELKRLNAVLIATPADKLAWSNRLSQVSEAIKTLQTEINTLNTDFLNGVKSTQQTPQAMRQIAKDSKGLVTQGAILGFVNSVTRLNAIETSEGNVQLSYFDNQGRMRQTNYDATADSKNATFEQWIPDAQRTCLNFNNSNSVVKLNQPLYLPKDWSIEAWFVHPLPEAGEWNTLTRGKDADHHILVRNRKQLGIFLNNDPLGQNFYDSGFNMGLLSEGWHHLTVIGKGDTTLFYIDGKKVGDTKAKALADAEENLKKAPNDATAKQKLENIKKATVKVASDVYAIGNSQGGGQPFGKVAEVRIWGVALTNDEIAVNAKTLLSGNEPGLLAYYPFNEATGADIRDQSGQGNGTVSGAIWWGCTAPIGNPGNNTVMQFDGVNDYIQTTAKIPSGDALTIEYWFKGSSLQSAVRQQYNGYIVAGWYDKHIISTDGGTTGISVGATATDGSWHHIVMTWKRNTINGFVSYLDGVLVEQRTSANVALPNITNSTVFIGSFQGSGEFAKGQIAEVRIWNKARSQAEIQGDMYQRLSGKEANLVAYYPLNEIRTEGSVQKVLDLAGNNHGTVIEAITVDDQTLPIAPNSLLCNEYGSVSLESNTKRKVAMMRRFFAHPSPNGVTLLPDKRVEALELKWIGNAQFAPTLLGYIEGPPPVPSENLTLEDDYNGATSVELTMSEDVKFNWTRSQDSGLGGTLDTFIGAGGAMSILTAPMGVGTSIETSTKVGFKGNFDFNYQFQNESSITSSSSLSMTDKLELRGTPEVTTKFPHLGTRFVPKNIGYALVVSAMADVFVTRLARSGKMIGYQVQPVDGIPPDVNTITFLMNPAYTMNGSLDGMTGSSATSDRFFKHVPEMRSQYGSLYPASYYRLQEAYDLKRQIEAEDKRRESYFSNFDVRLVDETSLNRNIDSGDAPSTVGLQREEDKPGTQMTDEEKKKAQDDKAQKFQDSAAQSTDKTSAATKQKQSEIQSKIGDQEKRVQATDSFAGWQKRMESIQIRSGKRNIVNTYVWDADGGLRTEAQSFANTVEHTIGGSFSMNAGLGLQSEFSAFGVDVELTAQATVNLTQTMSKTELRSKGFELNVDLSGLEYKGITDYKDRPILPGEKVDRYRFMSFYLEGSTNHFQDFFNYVVDPEWLASNDEEARALRQAQAGKPNKAWRVLHRVTYVERPALMGFGRDVRKLKAAATTSENQQLLDKIAKLEEDNRKLEAKLEAKLDQILQYLQQSK